jgi:hypothetical protein
MNIFVLDDDAEFAAQYHCDKHVVKMILESAQILCTAHDRYGEPIPDGYKPTHRNHPCVVWASECIENYEWLWNLFKWLTVEYNFRYSKIHATSRKLLGATRNPPKGMLSKGFRTPFALAMPDKYKTSDAVTSYRNYYLGEKRNIATWSYCETPNWWK